MRQAGLHGWTLDLEHSRTLQLDTTDISRRTPEGDPAVAQGPGVSQLLDIDRPEGNMIDRWTEWSNEGEAAGSHNLFSLATVRYAVVFRPPVDR